MDATGLVLQRIASTVTGNIRNSHQRCSVRKGVLRNLAKFTGKHLYQNLFFKVAASDLQLYSKRDSGTSVFL